MARVAGPWTALFPLTYCLHVAEEYWGGETFYGWVSRLWSIDFTREEFLSLNAIAMGVMIAGTLAANLTPARWPIAALGFVTAANGLLHTIASIATASYSPGLVSGLLIWLPLGSYALRRAHRGLSRTEFWMGIGVGLAGHALISAVAFNS